MRSKKNNGVPAPQPPVTRDLYRWDARALGHWSTQILSLSFLFLIITITGCQSMGGNSGNVQSYSLSSIEAQWIQNGEPIEFENELWYPADGVEGFLDAEMRLVGEYKDVEFFIDKVDVRPFGRLYTKFGQNKFRFFEKKMGE